MWSRRKKGDRLAAKMCEIWVVGTTSPSIDYDAEWGSPLLVLPNIRSVLDGDLIKLLISGK